MSISGILSGSYSQNPLSAAKSNYQQQLQQLSQDLKAGNLTAAQSDFATLQKAAHNDFSTVQQALQNSNSTGPANPIHHHHISARGGSSEENSLLQNLSQVGQSLASGNLSSAQQAYATLQQQLQQFAFGGGTQSTPSPVSLDA